MSGEAKEPPAPLPLFVVTDIRFNETSRWGTIQIHKQMTDLRTWESHWEIVPVQASGESAKEKP